MKQQKIRSRHIGFRRGITSVLAMLFLVLFGMLALGFYATVTTSVQVTQNLQRTNKARLAAESGLQFMRYQLAHVTVPSTSTTVLNDLYLDLKASLENTSNLGGNTVSISGTAPNQIISIPAEPGSYIPIDNEEKTGFTVSIKEWDGGIIATIAGRSGATSSINKKSVALEFNRKIIPSNAFDYAIASKGSVAMTKGSLTGVSGISSDNIATVMSAKESGSSVNVSGGVIGGDLNVVSPAVATVTGGQVGGSTSLSDIALNHVHNVSAPDFPTFDTTVFKQYATNTYTSGSILSNMRIPANTNPQFAGGAEIRGILYVESPNTIQFRGNVVLSGFIVFEQANNSSVNVIDMRGNFNYAPLPSDSEYDALRSTTGISILGPTTSMVMSGSADSTLKGNIILGKFVTSSNAGNVTIDQGTLMTLDTSSTSSSFNGKNIKFKSVGKLNQPTTGTIYSQNYDPIPGSFQELN